MTLANTARRDIGLSAELGRGRTLPGPFLFPQPGAGCFHFLMRLGATARETISKSACCEHGTLITLPSYAPMSQLCRRPSQALDIDQTLEREIGLRGADF